MGDIADDIIDGSCCSFCGQYFQHEEGGLYVHEHPVVCWDCWDTLTTKERREFTKADVETF